MASLSPTTQQTSNHHRNSSDGSTTGVLPSSPRPPDAVSSNSHEVSEPLSSGTKATKDQQNDKLRRVRRSTVAAVIVMDLILISTLSYQLASFKISLSRFLSNKVENSLAFYQFQYNELFEFAELGLSLYTNDSRMCDVLLETDARAGFQLRGQFKYDQQWRGTEFIGLVNTTGHVLSSSGSKTAVGVRFSIGDVFDYYLQRFPASGTPLRTSLMIDRHVYETFDLPKLKAASDPGTELSWETQDQILSSVVLFPIYCNQPRPQGFLVSVHAIARRQNEFATLTLNVNSGMGSILARNTETGVWKTAFSYNHAGSSGASNQFPDLSANVFTSDQLHTAALSGHDTVTGLFSYEDIPYTYAIRAIPSMSLGESVIAERAADVEIVCIYAEPVAPVQKALGSAMSWQIPWIIILLLWSALSVRFVLRKFIDPMQRLIDTVKKKRMKEFNELIRTLKANHSAIWGLLFKVIVTEAVLLGLIFANARLLDSILPEFTSAVTEGKLLSYVITSRSNSLLYYLASWSMDPSFHSIISNGTAVPNSPFSASLRDRMEFLHVDAICVVGLDSKIVASSYASAVGLTFPETGIMHHLGRHPNPDLQVPFFSHSAWNSDVVNMTIGELDIHLESPAIVRLIVAPIRSVSFNNRTDAVQFDGDLVGALIIVRVLNGADSIWNVKSFTPGYFGLYLWNLYMQQFQLVTSVFKTADRSQFGAEIVSENPDLLLNGLASGYNHDHVVVQNGIHFGGAPYTASIVPFGRPDEVILSPSAVNVLLIRGLPESEWEAVASVQLAIQIANMLIVVLSALIKILLAWWPIRRFLRSLERVFTIPSISDDGIAKREKAAAAIINQSSTSQPAGRAKSISMSKVTSQH